MGIRSFDNGFKQLCALSIYVILQIYLYEVSRNIDIC